MAIPCPCSTRTISRARSCRRPSAPCWCARRGSASGRDVVAQHVHLVALVLAAHLHAREHAHGPALRRGQRLGQAVDGVVVGDGDVRPAARSAAARTTCRGRQLAVRRAGVDVQIGSLHGSLYMETTHRRPVRRGGSGVAVDGTRPAPRPLTAKRLLSGSSWIGSTPRIAGNRREFTTRNTVSPHVCRGGAHHASLGASGTAAGWKRGRGPSAFFQGTPSFSGAPRNPPSRLHLMRDPVNPPLARPRRERAGPLALPDFARSRIRLFVEAGSGALPAGVVPGG